MSSSEFPISSPPSDGISRVAFGRSGFGLFVSSWDGTVRLYDAASNMPGGVIKQSGPVLSVCGGGAPTEAYAGCADGSVNGLDFTTGRETLMGRHDGAARCVAHCADLGLVVSGSWDQTVRLWDPRAMAGAHVGTTRVDGKVFAMALTGQTLVVGTSANRHVGVYDLRNMSVALQSRDSPLKHQTRAIEASPDGSWFAIASVEGRVAVEYLDLAPAAQSKKYAFNCHRTKHEDGTETAYPINAIAFHPVHGTFATGGADGQVILWDGLNKRRLCQPFKYDTSIASMAFSADGSLLAVAASYTFERGPVPHPADSILVRAVTDDMVRPKAKPVGK
jgi:cell cycle arrest protein BUB3